MESMVSNKKGRIVGIFNGESQDDKTGEKREFPPSVTVQVLEEDALYKVKGLSKEQVKAYQIGQEVQFSGTVIKGEQLIRKPAEVQGFLEVAKK